MTELIRRLIGRSSLGLAKTRSKSQADYGAVAAGSPHAVRIGLNVLKAGGSAGDAAAAMAFAMMVADPVNCSPAGRAQILFRMPDGDPVAINGTTRAPAAAAPGCAPVPLPGCLGAILQLHKRTGKLPLVDLLDPVITLARDGFEVPEELAAVWQLRANDLEDADARRWYLPEGRPLRAGETFRHSGLAAFFEKVRSAAADPFAIGSFLEVMAGRLRSKGIVWSNDDALTVEPAAGETVRLADDNWELVSIGRQGWGHTLLQIVALNQWAARAPHSPADRELAQLLAVSQAFEDRPQHLRSLKPKSEPLAYEDLVSRALVPQGEGWGALRDLVSGRDGPMALSEWQPVLDGAPAGVAAEERDTTHLSVIDKTGLQVALTQSIGPHFGARIADPDYGLLLAHSYRMEFDPVPGADDVTEQCPTLLNAGGVRYALGGAGSERIPGAVASVIRHLLAGCSLETAICMPRANWVGPIVRLHEDCPPGLLETLKRAQIPVEETDRGPIDHLGIVHAVGLNPDGTFQAAADPAYAGAAGIC